MSAYGALELFILLCGGGVVLIIIMGILIGFAAYLRNLRHKETIALAEKGLIETPRRNGNGQDMLRWGIIITALGTALCLGLYPLGFVLGGNFPLNFGPWMLIGLIPTFFGLALILINQVTKDKTENGEGD
jgi:hypothetical protein